MSSTFDPNSEVGLAELAREIDHAVKRGYCRRCDGWNREYTITQWVDHKPVYVKMPPVGPINEQGFCSSCAEKGPDGS